jgi:hypothetical protein
MNKIAVRCIACNCRLSNAELESYNEVVSRVFNNRYVEV